MMFSNFKVRLSLYLFSAISVITLGACGGGSSDAGNSQNNSNYVSWKNNPNDTIVLDGKNQKFQVDAKDQTVVFSDKSLRLVGLTADTAAVVRYNGTVIGSVTSSSNGAAVFTCSNSNRMIINVSENSNSYTFDCGTAPGTPPGTPPGTGTGSNSHQGQSAIQCVKFGQNGTLSTVTNTCNQTIWFSYCTLLSTDSVGLYQCKAIPNSISTSGYKYDRAADFLGPGKTTSLQGSSGSSNRSFVVACVSPATSYLTGFNTSTITYDSIPTGMCYLS